MKLSTTLLLLPALIQASTTPTPISISATPSSTSPSDAEASSSSSASASFSAHLDSLKSLPKQQHYPAPALQQFIFELNNFDHAAYLLEKRQVAAGGGVGPVDPLTDVPTQAPTVTNFVLDGTPVVYTQKFSATPEQWPGPKKGTIGLGSHRGEVGVVKTDS